ncbi:MAG: DNA mismatch endonuclease Vsr [Gemmatimonadetes bacterium]|jgi:DNA mismatch endonuclease, patch repair protein|nr:DNA mismatch endonuclease Vsr [Gemmatimonadota bacterium]
MSDVLTPTQRRLCMSRIRGKDTKPEIFVRSLVHRLGYRFRLHRRDLPGTPDLVFPSRRKIIFVHGCFWHQHPSCRYAAKPKTRADFWAAKLTANSDRDQHVLKDLRATGWDVLVIWECETTTEDHVAQRLISFLG